MTLFEHSNKTSKIRKMFYHFGHLPFGTIEGAFFLGVFNDGINNCHFKTALSSSSLINCGIEVTYPIPKRSIEYRKDQAISQALSSRKTVSQVI